LGPKAI
jgi:hypothetical protein